MLLSQHGCGNQQSDLTSAHHGLEGRTDGHLGFAKSHVATQEAVHGLGLFHIPFYLGNGTHLVHGFFELERSLEFPLPIVVRGKGMTGPCRPHCLHP